MLVKLIMNSLYGEQIRRDLEESYQCKYEMLMMTEYDERVLDHRKINYGNYIVRLRYDEGLQDEVKESQYYASSLGCFRTIKQ